MASKSFPPPSHCSRIAIYLDRQFMTPSLFRKFFSHSFDKCVKTMWVFCICYFVFYCISIRFLLEIKKPPIRKKSQSSGFDAVVQRSIRSMNLLRTRFEILGEFQR